MKTTSNSSFSTEAHRFPLLTAEHSRTTERMTDRVTEKDPLAVEFGRRGARARMTKMTPEERRRIARLAAKARWSKKPTVPDGPDGGPDGDSRPIRTGI